MTEFIHSASKSVENLVRQSSSKFPVQLDLSPMIGQSLFELQRTYNILGVMVSQSPGSTVSRVFSLVQSDLET